MLERTMLTATASTSGQEDFWVGLMTIVIVAAGIVMVAVLRNKKTRSQHWSGTISDKKIATSTDEDGDRTTRYELVVAVDGETKPKKVVVSSALFATFSIGNKIEKKLGELQPSIMEDSGDNSEATPPGGEAAAPGAASA